MSESEPMTRALAAVVTYTNTFFHKEPFLDITKVPQSMHGTLDFLISSEVFEHVAPPVAIAFENARRLLKPNGFMILSVPYATGHNVETKEHFPLLDRYEIRPDRDGKTKLFNTTRTGRVEVFDDLVFHGGPGMALEMRVFSESGLLRDLANAGFDSVSIMRDSDFEHGVYWPEPWSRPLVARVRKAV